MVTYHPGLPNIRKIIRELHPILESSERCKNAINSVPFVAFRKPKSLGDYLVRAKVDSRGPRDSILGTVKCSSRRCEACKYMEEKSHFMGSQNDRRYTINYNFNCNSSNVVYLITCTVQPKNNARAKSGARSSCAARMRKLSQEAKMPCFCGLPRKNIQNARSQNFRPKKPQEVKNPRRKNPQEVAWSSRKKFIYSARVNDRRRSYRLQPQELFSVRFRVDDPIKIYSVQQQEIYICIACVDDRRTRYPVQQQEIYTCTCRARSCLS